MLDSDFQYLLDRLGLKPSQPSAKALHRVYIKGHPFGPAARMFSVPLHKMEPLWQQAERIVAGFTVTDGDLSDAGVSHVNVDDANRVLSFQRRREAASARSVQIAAMRSIGLSDEQISAALGETT